MNTKKRQRKEHDCREALPPLEAMAQAVADVVGKPAELVGVEVRPSPPLWTVPERSATPMPAESTPIYVTAHAQKRRQTAGMAMPQRMPTVELAPADGGKRTDVIVGSCFLNEQHLVDKIVKNFQTKECRVLTFPPKWVSTPTTHKDEVKVEMAFLTLTLDDLATIKTRITKNSSKDWHLVFVVVDDNSYDDLDVTLTEPEPYPGPNKRPTHKILTKEEFERVHRAN